MKKVTRHVIGWFFIVLGIAGLFLPILQGILFLFVGMLILARDVPFFHDLLIRLEKRHPLIFEKAKGLHVAVSNWWRRKTAMFAHCRWRRSRAGHRDKDQ